MVNLINSNLVKSNKNCFYNEDDLWEDGILIFYVSCLSFLNSTAPPTVRIVHSGLACNIEEERYSERVYTIREGETLELTCLVTGHPRPQVSPEL